MYVEVHDRRIAVFRASEQRLPVKDWDAYEAWLKNGGAAKLRYYFEHIVDYSAFNPRDAAPATAAKAAMIEAGRSDVESWISDLKRNPDSVLKAKPYALFRTTDLHDAYDPAKRERIKPNGFATKLGESGLPRATTDHTIIEGVRQRLWIVRGDVAAHQRMTPAQLIAAYTAERTAYQEMSQKDKDDESCQESLELARREALLKLARSAVRGSGVVQ
jgi:hypothetical protein